ncbi:MAG: DUF1800 domain-containing protein [Pyrinomonadaceae bacterium]
MKDHACLLRGSFAAICASLLVFIAGPIQKASAAPQKSPVLYSASTSSTRAVALESVTLRAEPFQLTSDGYFGAGDTRTRIALFGTDFEFLQGEGVNALSADAQDAAGALYPLSVEYVGTVPNFDGVYMVIVRLNDSMPANLGDVLLRLRLHGMASNRVRVAIGQVGGGPPDDFPGVGTPAPLNPPPAASPLTLAQYQAQYDSPSFPDDADIIRFLEQSSWGPKADRSDFNRVRQTGMEAYLNEQFNTAVANPAKGSNYPDLLFPAEDGTQCPASSPDPNYNQNACNRDNFSAYPIHRTFYTNSLYSTDQLRQRVAFALHQIMVVSSNEINRPSWMTVYLQALDRNAFGNYRTLLQEVTLTPAMGEYLDMRLSTQNNPNENFAREILQLFAIGTDVLNLDGTPQKDAQGMPLASYTQNDVNQFTKVFTGWNFVPGTIAAGTANWRDPMIPRFSNTTAQHDTSAKTLFSTTLNGCPGALGAANQTCAQNELTAALDVVFNHPNVGPFVSKQLIQHLVTSNPSPAYVQRVATVFNTNRTNPSQMREVVRAILLDPEARGNVKSDPNYGKLREPAQCVAGFLRTFNVKSFDKTSTSDGVLGSRSSTDFTGILDQPIYQPPTVFSYYQPAYEVPGSKILGPAFGILSTSTTLRRANVVNTLTYSGVTVNLSPIASNPDRPRGTSIDIANLEAIAVNPSDGQVTDALNSLLLHGTMSSQMRASIITAMNAINDANLTTRHQKRARVAVYLAATSSQYDIQR